MAKAKVGDINMYYEMHGEGEPFVIINGHGGSVEFLYRTIPVYSGEYQLILFDNRGAGRSDTPDTPYTTKMMADDLAGLLDTIGIDSIHLMGISMGGMIAQQFALLYAERTRSLILGCTYCQGPDGNLTSEEVAQAKKQMSGLPVDEMMKETIRMCVSPKFIQDNPNLIEELLKQMSIQPVTPHGPVRQMQAILTHDTYGRLPEIEAPTLVVHGEVDRVVPVENARIIASRIPGAEMVTFANTEHIFLEAQDEFNSVTLDLLRKHRISVKEA